MFDVKDLSEQVNRLKRAGGCIGNNFLSLAALTEFSKQEGSRLSCSENAIALICEDVGVTRLHFYLSSLEAVLELKELIDPIPQRPVVADCVGRKEQVDALSGALCGVGFELRARMKRLRGTKTCRDPVADGMIQNALPQDAEEIRSLLYETFDPYVYHLPDRGRLLRAIEDHLVYCIKENGEIAAVQYLERTGKNGFYIYQGVVKASFRGLGLGSRSLLFLPRQDNGVDPFYTLWIENGNAPCLRVYQKNGAVFDGLEDAVLILR